MSDSDGSAGQDGSRQLSRRKILWGLATTGAAASAGGGTAALLMDTEEFGAEMTAGTLDLKTAWGNDAAFGNDSAVADGVPTIDLGEVQEGDTGSFHVDVAVSGNPAYVWFRTKCHGGTGIEEAIGVTVSLVTPDGTTTLATGPLAAVRRELGPGVRLDDVLSPDETWQILVEWEILASPDERATVTFDFGFHAEQARHVGSPPAIPSDWADCNGTDGHGSTNAISYVAFCTDGQTRIESVTISDDGLTLEQYSLAADVTVEEIVIKYGTSLDVFTSPDPSGTFTVGTGGNADFTYQKGNGKEFMNSGGRTVNYPCLTNSMSKEEDLQ